MSEKRKSWQLSPEERAKLREIVKEEKTCERCCEDAASHLLHGDALCEDCYKGAKSLEDAERRASGRQIDYAELALGVEERDTEIGMLRADAATMAGEIERLTTALAAANAKIDELKRAGDALNASWWAEHADRVTAETNLGLAQSEARALREELRRMTMPDGGGM